MASVKGMNDTAQPPSQRFPELQPFFDALHHTRDSHHDVTDQFVDATKRELTVTDLFVLGIIKRSLDLVAGIELLIEQWNYSAMAPLVRLQVDSLLRLHYVASLAEPQDIMTRLTRARAFEVLGIKPARSSPMRVY